MSETKHEREQRLNRQRVARHRLRKKLDAELAKKNAEKGIYSVQNTKEMNLELLTQELEFIQDECHAEGKPLWASKKFKEWEEKISKLDAEGKLPNYKKWLRENFFGVKI